VAGEPVRVRVVGLVSVLGLVLAGAACGGAPATSKQAPKVDPIRAVLRFTNCMRAEGVPMLDPGPHGNILYNAPTTPEAVIKKAQGACNHFLPPVTFTPQQHAVALRRMIKFVDCMSAHRQPVQLLNGPGVGYAVRQGGSVDVNSPLYKAAEATCTRKYLRTR
jgi:hypothetical protein